MKPRKLSEGPYNGQQMHPCPTGRTLSFTAKGQTGFYDENGRWNSEAKVLRFPSASNVEEAHRATNDWKL